VKGKLDVVFANRWAKYAPLGKITEEFFDSISTQRQRRPVQRAKALPLLLMAPRSF